MQQRYLARSQLDAQRFRAFLAQHDIEAEIRESPVEISDSPGEPNPTGFSVWAATCWAGLTFAAILMSTAAGLAASGQLGMGASGILFAFYGFTVVASVQKRLLPRWLVVLVSIWLLYVGILDIASVLDHHIFGRRLDSWPSHAHLAGFGLGLLFALAFVVSWKPRLTRPAFACVLAAACVPFNGSPWLPDWLVSRADREYRHGNLQAAIGWYSRAISRSDRSASTYVGRGQVLLFDGQLDEALADCAAALALDPKIPNARALRALALQMRSELDAAWDEANVELQNGQNTAFAYSVRGGVAQARYELDAATKDFERAINLEPGIANHWAMSWAALKRGYETWTGRYRSIRVSPMPTAAAA